MKTVIYEGYEIEVPDWVNFVAGDFAGDVYMFADKPDAICLHPKEHEYIHQRGAKFQKHDLMLPWSDTQYPLLEIPRDAEETNQGS